MKDVLHKTGGAGRAQDHSSTHILDVQYAQPPFIQPVARCEFCDMRVLCTPRPNSSRVSKSRSQSSKSLAATEPDICFEDTADIVLSAV